MDGMLAGHALDDVLDDFDKLKASYASSDNDHCSRYDVVRLVTLLEQFCRIECQRRGSCSNHQWKKHRPSVHVLVDVFQMFDAKINRKKCEAGILLYYDMTDSIVPIKSD